MRPMLHVLAVVIACLTIATTAEAEKLPLYIGTGGDAIYLSQFDTDEGTLSKATPVASTDRPSFLWIHPATDSLYSVSELRRGKQSGGAAIVAWSIDSVAGQLRLRNKQDAGGDGPCFVAVSQDGRYAAIANYGGGSVSLFPIADDGSVQPATATVQHSGSSINPRRQGEPHAHSSRFDPSGRRVAVADLGTDKVYLYDIGDAGSLDPSQPAAIDVPPGSGPRHFVFSPDEKFVLILGELSGTITTVRYAPPKIETVDTISTMGADVADDAPRGSAEILFHPNGRWVYATNRGPNEIAVFDYDAATGKLQRTSAIASGGQHPRNFRISPDGRFLLCANQQSNNIVVFAIDPSTGELSRAGKELSVDQPMCLKFLLPK
ncbi:MAG: lactonase family protein [Pirellulaceae bacterium]|nr:lactonase family protein [Pirellulaceae bacterium]